MPSSTSVSESAFTRAALGAFLCALAALLVPYEALVRAAERRWGIEPARIAPRREGTPHVDMFLEDLAAGKKYRVLAVGTSRIQQAIHPDTMEPLLGPTYNLGMIVGSSIVTLEFLESMKIYPQRLIVGVSPMDLTPLAVKRGQDTLARRRVASAPEPELTPTVWTRRATYALLHSAAPDRRRNLGQWLDLRRNGGEVLAFLNNEEATAPPDRHDTHGYYLVTRVATPDRFTVVQWPRIPGEYASHREELAARFVAVVRRFRARGCDVVLVRTPISPTSRRFEDAQTSFTRDAVALAQASGAPYVDGQTFMGDAFVHDLRNFSDSEHLNEAGAIRFTRAVGGWMTRGSPGTP